MGLKQVAFLRTNRFDAQAEAQVEALSRARDLDVVVCADERQGPVDTGGWPKISLTAESIERLGLYHHERAGRHCGDYFLYHVLEARPGRDFYWMVEPDLLIDFLDPSDFFSLFADARHDLIAPNFGAKQTSWVWHAAMAQGAEDVFGAWIQVVRLSGRAVRALHEARAAASATAGDKTGRAWPNDESFVATSLMRLGFECADVNAFSSAPLYRRETYRTGNPLLLDDCLQRRGSRELYHPVVPRDIYLDKLRKFHRRTGRLTAENRRVLLEFFGAEVAAEFGDVTSRGRSRGPANAGKSAAPRPADAT